MITKVTNHISPNEQLIFERSQPGRAGFSLPPLDVDETPLEEMIPRELQRDDALAGMPEVSEVDVEPELAYEKSGLAPYLFASSGLSKMDPALSNIPIAPS